MIFSGDRDPVSRGEFRDGEDNRPPESDPASRCEVQSIFLRFVEFNDPYYFRLAPFKKFFNFDGEIIPDTWNIKEKESSQLLLTSW